MMIGERSSRPPIPHSRFTPLDRNRIRLFGIDAVFLDRLGDRRGRKLRKFFEVDRYYVTVAALKALADEGSIPAATVAKAIKKYGIDPDKPNPVTV